MNFNSKSLTALGKEVYPILLIILFTANVFHEPRIGLFLLPLSVMSLKLSKVFYSFGYNLTFFVLLINIFLILSNKESKQLILQGKYIFLFIGLSVVSCLWSAYKMGSFESSLVFATATSSGLVLALNYTLEVQLNKYFWALFILIMVNICCIIFLPEIGIVQAEVHLGAWRGIFASKNFLGPVMVLGALLSWFRFATERCVWAIACGVAATILVLGSSSKTAFIIYLFIFGVVLLKKILGWLFRKHKKIFYVSLSGLVSGLLLIALNLDFLLGFVGRDLTFTGRTNLWPLILENIWQRPFWGYGFQSFWQRHGQDYLDIWASLDWYPHHAHNIFLEICLDSGLIGLVAFLMQLLFNGLRLMRKAVFDWHTEIFFCALYYVFFLGINLTESMMFSQYLFWVIYVALNLSVAKLLRAKGISELQSSSVENEMKPRLNGEGEGFSAGFWESQ